MTTTMESKITRAIIELADNGYIMHSDDLLLVYTNKMDNGYRDMIAELMSDLHMLIDAGEYTKIRVRVDVEPIEPPRSDGMDDRYGEE